jgi:hypothetical protein
VTGCDFLWAVCGVRGAVCRAVCGVCAAVMFGQCAVVAAVRDVVTVRACGACLLHAVCECAMCGAWLVGVRCVG